MNHLRNMYLYFLAATVAAFAFGCGTSVAAASLSTLLLAGVAAVIVSGCAVLGGIFGTMQMRMRLGLRQTGRVLQYASFTLSAYVGLLVASFVFGSLLGAITVSAPFWTALAIFLMAFIPATLFGEVPWQGRTWLPVRM